MFKVVYSKKYYYQAIELSAQINQHLLDTCEIEEADDQFFDYHKNQMVDANERFNLYLNPVIFKKYFILLIKENEHINDDWKLYRN